MGRGAEPRPNIRLYVQERCVMKKVIQYCGLGVIILLMTAAALTFLAPHLGWSVDTVFSGSMEPKLKVGSVVITRPAEPQDIRVGDIWTAPL